jgi:hypothetical protein
MIKDAELSECSRAIIDDANVPVNIRISEPDEDNDKWVLSADNYMPRRARIAPEAYSVEADTREELVLLVQENIVPLYEAALLNLRSESKLYYWS